MTTISAQYRKQNEQAHETDSDWGTTGHLFAEYVYNLAQIHRAESILDYGAGKQTLKQALLQKDLRLNVFSYDPCIPEISKSPGRHDVVSCTDVLEHVEPECLDAVLDDLKRVTKKAGFFTVATGPAKKKLPDGRNAHLIVEGYEWWLPKIWERFQIIGFENMISAFLVIVHAR